MNLSYTLYLAVIFCLLFGGQTAYAKSRSTLEKYKVYPLYLEEEASSDHTSFSIRDKQGFLWVATDNGLKRYDGYNLRNFTMNLSDPTTIGSNSINYLLVASTGELWAAGTNLSQYHPELETFTRYDVSDYKVITTMHEAKNKLFWVGGEGFGLRCFDTTTHQVTESFYDDSDKGYIQSIIPHGETDSIWVASSGGLYLFDTVTHTAEFYSLPLNFGVGIESIRSMTEDRLGRLWLATQQGLIVLEPKTKKIKRYFAGEKPGSLSTNTLISIFTDSHGSIWIGTDKNGVLKYQPESDSFIHIPASTTLGYSFPVTAINSIYEDDKGTLWFGSGSYGVYRISQHLEKFTSFQHNQDIDNSLGFNNVLDLLEDRNGNIWIATDGRGVDRLDPKTQIFTHYRNDPSDAESLSSDSVISLAEDSHGNIWVGTWEGGLNKFNSDTGKFTRIQRDHTVTDGDTLANNNIFRIHIDEEDRIFLSVWLLGLQIYNPEDGRFTSYFPQGLGQESGARNVSINDILPTGDGKYWIAGFSGVDIFDPETEQFSPLPISRDGGAYDLHQDREGTLWIATISNLIRYNPRTEKSKYYSTSDGLVDNFVVSIEEDTQGHLWLGTRRGLNRFTPKTQEFLTYKESDGLAGSKFNRFSHLKTKSEKMYFGGNNGFSFFDPMHLPRNSLAPTVHITGVELAQNYIQPKNMPWISHSNSTAAHIELSHKSKDISFEFTALNYISPAKNLYRYRLKGLEPEWINVNSNRRRVRYTNLSPGDYTFQVLASNNEGVWSGSAKELKVTILPAWWQTWYARVAYLLIALGIMYSFSFWRLRTNRLQKIELKKVVEEKTAELKQANHSIKISNAELEQRVTHRTKELSIEIEERRVSEEKATYVAYHDPLTDLYNRAWLLGHLNELIDVFKSDSAAEFALLFIGGDDFKKINDNYGHIAGDALLKSVSKKLSQCLSADQHVARLGGDEFAIVIDFIQNEEQLINLATNILDKFNKPFLINKVPIHFRVSIGMLIFNSEYNQSAQILRNADIALRKAKENGRGRYQMFDADMLKQTLDLVALETDLKQALEKNQFSVVFQPIITIDTQSLTSFEILLRWNHPVRGMVPPDKFIPIAESIGIIFDVGLWVLEQACKQYKQWQQHKLISKLPTIAVNLSPLQLAHGNFLKRIDAVFNQVGVDKSCIKFEITESAIMENTNTVDQLLESLRERGIELAIDDFGTGYSSLSYLDKLPVQILKIDRSFVSSLPSGIDGSVGANEIVRATISLAHNLNMLVVAEGIETQEQMDALASYGCDYGQGYMIARPLSPEDATEFLLKSNQDIT